MVMTGDGTFAGSSHPAMRASAEYSDMRSPTEYIRIAPDRLRSSTDYIRVSDGHVGMGSVTPRVMYHDGGTGHVAQVKQVEWQYTPRTYTERESGACTTRIVTGRDNGSSFVPEIMKERDNGAYTPRMMMERGNGQYNSRIVTERDNGPRIVTERGDGTHFSRMGTEREETARNMLRDSMQSPPSMSVRSALPTRNSFVETSFAVPRSLGSWEPLAQATHQRSQSMGPEYYNPSSPRYTDTPRFGESVYLCVCSALPPNRSSGSLAGRHSQARNGAVLSQNNHSSRRHASIKEISNSFLDTLN